MLLSRTAGRVLVTIALTAVFVGPATAASRARLSADLASQLTAGSQSIDVIVHGDRATVEALARRYNVVVKKPMKSGAVLRVTAGQLAAIADDGSQDHLSADIPIRSSADVVAESIGADQVWAGTEDVAGLSGQGIGVAVIDSGVDLRHAALRRRVLVTRDFTGGDGTDGYGHGTHVAALIAGSATGDYRGIAYGANIINLRVLDGRGAGQASDVIEAIDWAIDNRSAFNIRVINVSLGAPVLQPYRDDPLCEAVERAVSAGIVVVASAGNGGATIDGRPVYGSITSPGNDPSVITVGALDLHDTPQRSDDTVAKYSAKGPTMYDLVLKPDVVAPGSRVVSAEAAGSYLAATYPERHVTGSGASSYMQLSGTSMAAGVVSGTVALMLEGRPALSPRGTKKILQLTSSLLANVSVIEAGSGCLNALNASRSSDVMETGGLSTVAVDVLADQVFNSSVLPVYQIARGIQTESIVWDVYGAWVMSNAQWIAGKRRQIHDGSIVWDRAVAAILGDAQAGSIVWDVQGANGTTGDSIVWD